MIFPKYANNCEEACLNHYLILGNRDTLWTSPISRGMNMSEEMRKFFDKFYSANIMRLVLYGPQTLDELENLVGATFSDIPNKNVRIPETPKDAFDNNILPRWVEVVPELDINMLIIMIPLESNVSELNLSLKAANEYAGIMQL